MKPSKPPPKPSRRSRPPRRWGSPLAELIHISRAVGADPDLVQGGGGNTSVKSRDGRRIFVKASGTSLGSMSARRGWAEMELAALRRILAARGLAALPAPEREKEVLRLLDRTVVRPAGARPSVESSLHALLDRVVIHTHPVGLNALLSSRSSRKLAPALLGSRFGVPLYIPYVDPGYVLARRVEEEIQRYRCSHGRLPAVLFLENHGLFVTAGEVEECLAISRAATEAGRRFAGGRQVNPFQFRPLAPGPRDGAGPCLAPAVREALLEGGVEICLVAPDLSPRGRELVRLPWALAASRRGAFTPDQIVYCRTRPLALPAPPAGAGAPSPGWLRRAASLVLAYRRRAGLDPRVVIVAGRGVFYAAPDVPQLRIVSEVYRSAMTTLLEGRRAGGARFLTPRQARFIEEWEVEAFRARLAAGAGRPLLGKVAAVAGAGSPAGGRAAAWLLGKGATVVALDRDGPSLERLSDRLGPGCIPLSCDPRRERPLERALGRIRSALGGVDILVGSNPLHK
jgi:rhamnose utilization protein RhaD (predicted bifunctional aldolase and dehydrogenase)